MLLGEETSRNHQTYRITTTQKLDFATCHDYKSINLHFYHFDRRTSCLSEGHVGQRGGSLFYGT